LIPKSYAKINSGPFVQSAFGPRLLRQSELERLRGSTVATGHFATAAEILGQGVQTRVFRRVLQQVADHIAYRPATLIGQEVISIGHQDGAESIGRR